MRRIQQSVAVLLLGLLILSTGCNSRDSKQAEVRAQTAAAFQTQLCGPTAHDWCKVAAFDTKNGPALVIKYSRANDEFSLPLARNADWTKSLAAQGFTTLLIADGLYYGRSWTLSMNGAPEKPASLELSRDEWEVIRRSRYFIQEESGLASATVTIPTRTPLTVEISSPEMTAAVVSGFVNDFPAMQLLRSNHVGHLVFRDRSTVVRELDVPADLSNTSNTLSRMAPESVEPPSDQEMCGRYYGPSNWRVLRRKYTSQESPSYLGKCRNVELVVEAKFEDVVARYSSSFPFLKRTDDSTGDDGTRRVILDGYSRGRLEIWFYSYGPKYERTEIKLFIG